MTNNDPVIEVNEGKTSSETVPPTLRTVAKSDVPAQLELTSQDPRDWDPYHVWKKLIRKSPDPT